MWRIPYRARVPTVSETDIITASIVIIAVIIVAAIVVLLVIGALLLLACILFWYLFVMSSVDSVLVSCAVCDDETKGG